MDARKRLLIANGVDKTDSVLSYHYENGKCKIQYCDSPIIYSYNAGNVKILDLQKMLDPKNVIVIANGRQITGVNEILDFGDFYRIVRSGKKDLSYRRSEIKLLYNCLSEKVTGSLFDYFRETAEAVSLVTEDGRNILSRQYQKITYVQDNTVLASYLNTEKSPQQREPGFSMIYPFGLNQSQKRAVENAFSSQVSIIQGPPGTGKTQTILNIIANAVLNKKTVAVVSNKI